MNIQNNKKYLKICNLTPTTKNVNTLVKMVAFGRTIKTTSKTNGKKHTLTEALVGDQTGCVYLNLWDKQKNSLKISDYLKILNGYISLYRGDLRLNIGRKGKLEKTFVAPFKSVDLGNNKSSSKIKSYPPLNFRSKFGLIGLGRLFMDKPTFFSVDKP